MVSRIPQRIDRPLRANLRFGLADGIGYSLMVGFGESYLAAFALALGFGEIFTGLLATLPLLAGASLQLISPWVVAKLGSRRRWVMLCAALQIASFLPLVWAAFHGQVAAWVLLAAASLYWGAGFATGPAWTSWMESVIPRRIRTHYFARRTGFTQLALILALLAAGFSLEYGKNRGSLMAAFMLTFALAAASRAFSLAMLGRQTEPEKPGARRRELPLREAARNILRRAEGPFLLCLLLIQWAVMISGPFFAPYMLRRMALSYSEYVILIAAAFVAKVVVLLWGGKLTRILGPRRLLLLGGLGIVPVPGLWLISSSYSYLLALQVYSGIAWASYELGMLLMIFERIRVDERMAVLTLYNLAHAFCSVAGSLLGAGIFSWAGAAHAYTALFLVSSLGRAAAIPLLVRLSSVSPVRWMVSLQTIGVRPSSGGMVRPIFLARAWHRRRGRP